MTQFVEKRPTAVSVIGWFWIIVGGFMAVQFVGGPARSAAGISWFLSLSRGGIVVGVLVVLLMEIYRVPLVLIIRSLRSKKVRDAVVSVPRVAS